MTNKQEQLELVKIMAQAAYDKKAENINIMEVGELTSLADYFLVVSASNKKLTQTIADNIEDEMEEKGVIALHKEGYKEGEWILLDFAGVICHVFTDETRNFYALEKLWNDAVTISFEGK